jgi:hypothetical protein
MCLKCRLNLNLAYSIQQNMIKAEKRFKEQLSPAVIKQESDPLEEQIMNPQGDREIVVLLGEEVIKTEIQEDMSKPEIEPLEFDAYSCETCSRSFPSRHLLMRHRYNHVRRKCPICAKEITASNLKTHVDAHTSTPQICELCGATLKTKDNLRQHIFYSHNDSRHKCDFCDKVFKKKCNRDSHQKKEHLGNESGAKNSQITEFLQVKRRASATLAAKNFIQSET